MSTMLDRSRLIAEDASQLSSVVAPAEDRSARTPIRLLDRMAAPFVALLWTIYVALSVGGWGLFSGAALAPAATVAIAAIWLARAVSHSRWSVALPIAAVAVKAGLGSLVFVESLLQRLERLPDVRAVAISTGLPFASVEDSGIHFDGRAEGTAANHYRIPPDYVRVMEIPLVRGRLFTDRDTLTNQPVVLINERWHGGSFQTRIPLANDWTFLDQPCMRP